MQYWKNMSPGWSPNARKISCWLFKMAIGPMHKKLKIWLKLSSHMLSNSLKPYFRQQPLQVALVSVMILQVWGWFGEDFSTKQEKWSRCELQNWYNYTKEMFIQVEKYAEDMFSASGFGTFLLFAGRFSHWEWWLSGFSTVEQVFFDLDLTL